MSIAVRSACVGDAPDIASVQVEAWKVGYSHIYPSSVLDALSVADRVTSWAEQLTEGTCRAWVAAASLGDITGFVSVSAARDDDLTDVGEVLALYVRPSAWGGGVAAALLDESTRALAAQYASAVLWVLEGNSRARRFYERRGWQADGSVKEDRRGGMTTKVIRYVTSLEDYRCPRPGTRG